MTRYEVDAETILGQNYKITTLTTSNNNPKIDTTITVTATVTDVYGDAMSGETLTLTCSDGVFTEVNGSTITETDSVSGTTNAGGTIEFTYSCTSWGIITFQSGATDTQILVDGYKTIFENGAATITLQRNKTRAKLLFNGHSYDVPASWASMGANLAAAVANVRPRRDVCLFNHDALVEFQIQNDGDVYCQATNGTAINNKSLIGQVEWAIRDEDL